MRLGQRGGRSQCWGLEGHGEEFDFMLKIIGSH